MAVGWLTALKLVPWADVIEAAPGLAKSAKGFFKRTQEAVQATPDPAAVPRSAGDDSEALTQATQRVAALETRLAQATDRQQAAAELLDSLASQNARLVAAVDALDQRCQSLKVVIGIVAAVAVGTLIWVAAIAR